MRMVVMIGLLLATGSDKWSGTLARLEEARFADADQRSIELNTPPSFCVDHVTIMQPVCHTPKPDSAICTYVRREIVRPGCQPKKPEKVQATLTLGADGEWRFAAP